MPMPQTTASQPQRSSALKWCAPIAVLVLMSIQSAPLFGQDTGTEHLIVIENHSDLDLLEVRVHDDLDYSSAPNLLVDTLAADGIVEIPIRFGQRITVIRRRVEAGKRIAFTTGEDLSIRGTGYTLIVFQESFRLLTPAAFAKSAADPGGCSCFAMRRPKSRTIDTVVSRPEPTW